jgi:uncharacterized Zn-binding protein involved in type VI secretion
MPAAARVGDTSNHGGSVTGPGVSTVLIAGQPAAVAGDLHSCPLGSNSHPPVSPFSMGSSSVMIGSRAALRTSDACGCGATAAVGAPTVIIGG